MALTTAQATEIIASAGNLIKLLAAGYEQLNAKTIELEATLEELKISDATIDEKLDEMKQIVAENALLTAGPTTEVGEVVVDNPTPVADGVIKAIDEMPIELPTGGVVDTATSETVDTANPTSPDTVAEAIDELVTAVEEAGVEPAPVESPDASEPIIQPVPIDNAAEAIADPTNPTPEVEGNLFREA